MCRSTARLRWRAEQKQQTAGWVSEWVSTEESSLPTASVFSLHAGNVQTFQGEEETVVDRSERGFYCRFVFSPPLIVFILFFVASNVTSRQLVC